MRQNKPVAIANVLPMRDPFFRLDEKAQRSSFLGNPERGRKANRTAHMWTAGDLSPEELEELIRGDKTPVILGMRENLVYRIRMGMPCCHGIMAEDKQWKHRIAYEVYDLKDKMSPHKQKKRKIER